MLLIFCLQSGDQQPFPGLLGGLLSFALIFWPYNEEMEVQGVKCLTQGHTASAFGALPLSVHGSSWVFPSWRQELASPPPRWAPSCVRTLRGHILGIVPGQLMPDLPQGEPLCIFSPPPLSLESLEESRALSPRGDVELSKAARSPRGDPEAPINCSSCPGPPAVAPQRPALQLLQLLLRMNLSNTQTLPVSPSGAQASPAPGQAAVWSAWPAWGVHACPEGSRRARSRQCGSPQAAAQAGGSVPSSRPAVPSAGSQGLLLCVEVSTRGNAPRGPGSVPAQLEPGGACA